MWNSLSQQIISASQLLVFMLNHISEVPEQWNLSFNNNCILISDSEDMSYGATHE